MSKETTKGGAPGKDPGKAKPKRKLTREEKKQIAAIIRQAKGDGKAHTAHNRICRNLSCHDQTCCNDSIVSDGYLSDK